MHISIALAAIFIAVCWYRIAGKAGFNPWLGLLILVPVANLVFLAWFAFSEWPVHGGNGGDDGDDADFDRLP